MTSTSRLAAAVAAYGLPAARATFPAEVLAPGPWSELLADTVRHRTVGLLGVAVRQGALPTTADQRDELDTRLHGWLVNALHMERQLGAVVVALDDAGVAVRAIKGPALAHLAYPDPSWRVFGDLDILVPAERFAAAKRVLVGLGAPEPWPEVRPGYDERFAKDAVLHLPGVDIDLHRTLVGGPFGLRLPLARLFDEARSVRIGAVDVPTLGAVATFLHACLNGVLGDDPPRLASLRDVVQTRACLGDDDVAVALGVAEEWRIGAVVHEAIRLAWGHLDLDIDTHDPLHRWAQSYRAPAMDRRHLRWSTGTHRSYRRQLAAALVIPGIRLRARYLTALVFPQRSYLRARGWRPTEHARRALRRLDPRA